jgi:hypothetical protein
LHLEVEKYCIAPLDKLGLTWQRLLINAITHAIASLEATPNPIMDRKFFNRKHQPLPIRTE